MKNLTWILHSISLAAILFLWNENRNMHKGLSPNPSNTATTGDSSARGNTLPIAYFYTDSLLSNLGFFQEGEQSFKKKQEAMLNELRSKEATLQKEVQKIQENAQNMTRNELENAQQRLGKMEQDLIARKDKMSMQFAEETAEFNEKLHQKVISYLKEFNADGKFQYVFSVSRDGNIFYSDPKTDITPQMIKALNEKYSNK